MDTVSLVIVSAPAKLNLCLHVVNKRADGYHLLESLVAFADCADRLVFRRSDSLTIAVDGEFSDACGDTQNNLVMKAARLLQQYAKTTQGADIRLTKTIPVGAGLGGGSADAAATLHGLNQLWQLDLSLDALVELGAPLGADVAMCLHSKALIAQGIGEQITPVHIVPSSMHAVLVYPRMPLLSRDVYRAFIMPDVPINSGEFLPPISRQDVIGWLIRDTRNDLQPPAMDVLPELSELVVAMKKTSPTPTLIRMTGSGSCWFALLANKQDADQYAANLAISHSHWWIKAVQLR